MIEFIRRSLIQKAIEGDMKILAAGHLSSKQTVNFTLAEGKTTLTVLYKRVLCSNNAAEETYFPSTTHSFVIKGPSQSVCTSFTYENSYNMSSSSCEYSYDNYLGIIITNESIKSKDNNAIVDYIIFEIDE